MKFDENVPSQFGLRFNEGITVFQLKSLLSIALLVTTACLVIGPQFSFAQQVPTDPTSSHIFPAGGQRGTKVAVRVGGECLPPMTRFRLVGTGLTGR